MKDNPLKDKSYALALNIVKLCHELNKITKEYVLINQLLKSTNFTIVQLSLK